MQLSTILSILLATAVVANPLANPVAEAEPAAITLAPESHEIREAYEDATGAKCPSKICLKDAKKVQSCAKGCISSAASAVGCGTVTTNLSCQCKSSSAINARASNCVINSCGLGIALSVQAEVSTVCACQKKHPYTKCPA